MTNRRQCSKFDIIPYYKILFAFYIYLRRVSPVEQELRTFPEHMSSPPVFSGVRVTQSLVLCVCYVDRCLSCCFFFFIWSLMLYVLLQFTHFDYPLGIFKLFFSAIIFDICSLLLWPLTSTWIEKCEFTRSKMGDSYRHRISKNEIM